MPDASEWHLDRRVPIATIVAIMAQLGAFVWYASDFNTRLKSLETEKAKYEANRVIERITTIEANSLNTNKKLDQIDGQLDKVEAKVDRLLTR